MKTGLPILALFLVCSTATAHCTVTAENREKSLAELTDKNKSARSNLVESLVGPTSVFLDCGQSDAWESIDLLKQRYKLTDADMATAMADVLEKTLGETNVVRGSIRAGAAMMLGKYGTAGSLPILRSVALSKEDPAARHAFRSYQGLAPLDKTIELVEATYVDPDCMSYRRIRGIFFWHNEKKAKDGTMSAEERTQLREFMKRRVAVEPDVRDVLEIDGLLSFIDRDYAASRERMINIGKALKSGRPVDSFVMSNVLKRLESARDLVLEADKKKAHESEARSGEGAGK